MADDGPTDVQPKAGMSPAPSPTSVIAEIPQQ